MYIDCVDFRAKDNRDSKEFLPDIVGRSESVIDLKTGLNGKPRMPDGGPYLTDAEVQEIVDWIDAGCPDDPAA